jgi:hypothetical protein
VPERSEFYRYTIELGEGHGLFLATDDIDTSKAANNSLAMRLGIREEKTRAERFVELITTIINTLPAEDRQRRALEVALNFPSAGIRGKTLTARWEALSKESSLGVRTLQDDWADGADWLAQELVKKIDQEQTESQRHPAATDSTHPEEQQAASHVEADLRESLQERQADVNVPESISHDHDILSRPEPLGTLAPDAATPSYPGRSIRWRAIASVGAIITAGIVGALIFVTLEGKSDLLKNGWRTARCADVGNNQPDNLDPMWGNLFRQAYQRAGGETELGCPRTDDPSGYVHPWANGISQDLRGGKAGKARIMTLNDPRRVLVVAGTYYDDYTTPYGDNAAQTMGYPVSEPIPCGSTMKIVLLDGAEKTQYFAREQTPSAMVTNPRTNRLIWVPRDIWERYVSLGGPLGRLGGPVKNLEQTPGGAVQYFETEPPSLP